MKIYVVTKSDHVQNEFDMYMYSYADRTLAETHMQDHMDNMIDLDIYHNSELHKFENIEGDTVFQLRNSSTNRIYEEYIIKEDKLL